jgi:hypothetical protein
MHNFYSRKNEATVNHCVILNNKKEREKVRLKKCNDIKYQTNLAKIRMDSMLKDRLESINNRLLEEKLSFRKHSMRQKSRLGQIHKNVDMAYLHLENSGYHQENAIKAYSELFPNGQILEIGSIP